MPNKLKSDNLPKRKNLFTVRDYAQEVLHLAGSAALAIGAGVWAGPSALALSAGIAGVLAFGGPKLMDRGMSKIFPKREVDSDRHGLFPSIIKLTRQAGFKIEPTVYDFKLDRKELEDSDPVSNSPAQAQRIYNAAAFGLSKRSVMISTPLLDVLTSKEKHSVMAHEFGHLGAEHGKLRLAAGWLQTTAMFTAVSGLVATVGELGWATYMMSGVGSAAVAYVGRKMMPKNGDLYTRDGEMRPRARTVQVATLAAQEGVSVALLAIQHPVAVVTAAATEHGFFWGANLVMKSLSRRQEFQADRAAVALGADPLALVTSLRKIEALQERDEPELAAARNWRRGSPSARLIKMAGSLLKTHPDTQRRCRRLAKLATSQGRNIGEIKAALTDKLDISELGEKESQMSVRTSFPAKFARPSKFPSQEIGHQ